MATVDPVETQSTRARSMPYRGTFIVATFWTLCHVLSVVITAIALFLFLRHHKEPRSVFYLYCVLAGVLVVAITLLISFFKRRNARCPLCRGTPLLNSGALAHKNSFCLRPFNHGYTAVLSIAFTQRLTCMYCGTRYDLLKESSRRSRKNTRPTGKPPR
jgi:hypothetical protein